MFISLVEVFQMAVVIYWVGFLLVMISMQKFRYLCLTKSIVLPFSAPSSGNNWAQNKLIPRAFSVIPLFFSGNSFCTIDVIFLDITNIFQIWWTLKAGYQEFALAFEPIRNWELPQCFFFFLKNINKTNSLFSFSTLSR